MSAIASPPIHMLGKHTIGELSCQDILVKSLSSKAEQNRNFQHRSMLSGTVGYRFTAVAAQMCVQNVVEKIYREVVLIR
jgi:hypothetical protein